jgi:hypothetical protein
METYKYHALGDYASLIRFHSSLDGYSTQLVSPTLFNEYSLISYQGELEPH